MPFPRRHLYVTWGGTAWEGNEIWQSGVRFDRETTATEAELELLADALTTWHQSGSASSPRAQLAWVKTAPILPDGRYPADEDATLLDLDPPVDGVGGTGGAPQLALKMTWRTARRRGRAHVGGIYVPAPATAVNTAGRIVQSTNGIATLARDLLESMQEVLNAQAVVGSDLGAGLLQPITGVSVGDVMDTQRRRRNALVEVYNVPVVLPPQ